VWQYFKRIGKDSLIYGLSGVFGRFAGFLLLPFLTRVFTPADYGNLELLSTAGSIFSAFIMLCMNASLIAFFHDHGEARRNEIVVSNFLFITMWGSLLLVFGIAFGNRLFPLLFGIEVPYPWVILVLLTGFLVPLKDNFLNLLRLLFRPWAYFTTSVLSLAASIILILVLVLYLKQGIEGFLFAGLVAVMVSISISFSLTHRCFKALPSFSLTKSMLAFGFPLLPTDFALWGIRYCERVSILHWLSAHDLGLFAVGTRVAGVMLLVMFAFRVAWAPFALSIKDKPDADQFYRLVDRGLKAAGSLGSVLLLTVSVPVLYLMTPIEYHSGYKVVGFIAYGIFFSSIYWVSGLGVVLAKRSSYLTAAIVISAIVAVGFYVFLTPVLGILGASVAGCLGHLAGNLAVTHFGERVKPIGLRVSSTLSMAAVAFVLMFIQIWIFESTFNVGAKIVLSLLLCVVSTILFLRLGLGSYPFSQFVLKLRTMRKVAV